MSPFRHSEQKSRGRVLRAVGSEADILPGLRDVCFTPRSGHENLVAGSQPFAIGTQTAASNDRSRLSDKLIVIVQSEIGLLRRRLLAWLRRHSLNARLAPPWHGQDRDQ